MTKSGLTTRYITLVIAGLVAGLTSTLAIAGDSNWTAPRTSFGVPDVQGVWSYANRTSLERPDVYAGQLEIDEQTMGELMVSTPDYIAFLERTGAEAPGPTNVGGYNGFWITPGQALASMNGKYRTSVIIEPADGKIPWTEKGQDIRKQQRESRSVTGMGDTDGPEARTLSDRCLVSFASTAPFLSSLYNNHMQIVQSPTHVILLAEMVHNARIVRIDQDHSSKPYDQWLGDSIGYYEGDTLVVETIRFHQQQIARERLTSENIKLTERFTRVADGKMHYQFTIEDPELYTEPWTGELPMYTGENLYEYACHEGNYAMPGILAGARRLESEAANLEP